MIVHLYNNLIYYLKIIFYYNIIILGFFMFTWLFSSRFIFERLPKDIPLILTEIKFYIILYICFIYLYIVKSLLFPREQNIYLKKLMEVIFYPLKTFDNAWKTSYTVQPYYMTIMSNFISYLESTSTLHRHALYTCFYIIPRISLLLIFILDIFYFQKLHFVYKYILLSIFPLFYRYIKYSLKVYTDHLIIFAKQNYEHIFITNIIRLLFGQDIKPEAIYDGKKVSIEEYIEIIEENILHIKEFDLKSYIEEYECSSDTGYDDIESNIRYVGGGSPNDEFVKKHAKRFFNKNINHPILDLTQQEYTELLHEFDQHYPKIFILKDLIPFNDEIINNIVYKYIRIIIFTIYFMLWSYLLIISYPNIENFTLTELILKWLLLYIENIEPFSGLSIVNYKS